MNAQPPPLLRHEKEFLGIKRNFWIVILIAVLLVFALILGLMLSAGEAGKGVTLNNSGESGPGENSQVDDASVDPSAGEAASEDESESENSSEGTGSEDVANKQEGESEAKREGDPTADPEFGTTPDDSVTPSSSASDVDTEPDDSTRSNMTAAEKQKYSASEGTSDGLVGSSGAGGFFGLRATGSHIGYVVDISGSMSGARLDRAKKELLKSINELVGTQKFSVFFFSDNLIFDEKFVDKKPSESNRRKLEIWLNRISTMGGTNPWPAMEKGFAEKCDEIFLLSDGIFPQETSDLIRTRNKLETRINTISLNGSSLSLKKIARESGGQYIQP